VVLVSALINYDQLFNSFNHLYFSIQSVVGIKKELIGVLYVWTVSYIVTGRHVSKTKKLVALVALTFFCFGIRTSLMVFIVSLYCLYSGTTLRTRTLFFVMILLWAVFVVFFFNSADILSRFGSVIMLDVRGVMLFGVDEILRLYPVGIGFGYHDTYFKDIMELKGEIALDYGVTERFAFRDDAISTIESDWLMLFANFGYIGPLFVYGLLIMLLYRPKFDDRLNDYVRVLLLLYMVAGLTQDYIFRIHFFLLLVLLIVNSRKLSRPLAPPSTASSVIISHNYGRP